MAVAQASRTVVLITGGNRGIGLEVARALCESDRQYAIVLGSRHIQNGENAVARVNAEVPESPSVLSAVQLDVTSDDSIHAAKDLLSREFGRIDVLINNAGAGFDRRAQDGLISIRSAFNATWDTNTTGAHVLTHELVPLLLKSHDPRLLFVSSGTSSLLDTERFDFPPLAKLNSSPPAGWPKPVAREPVGIAYRASKAGLNMLMRHWTRVLKNDGVKVWGISPGFLATGFSDYTPDELREMGAQDAALGGLFMREVVEGKRDTDVGKVIKKDCVQSW